MDDEVDVARSVEALLEARGYEVELAHDGVDKRQSLLRSAVLQRLQVDPGRQLVPHLESGIGGHQRDEVVDQQPRA